MNFLMMKGLCQKIAKKYRRERETSSDEDNIPLMELGKRMREQEFAMLIVLQKIKNLLMKFKSKPMILMLKIYCKLL